MLDAVNGATIFQVIWAIYKCMGEIYHLSWNAKHSNINITTVVVMSRLF